MLVVTLNHNLPEWTDNIVNQLSRDPLFSQCELMVIDNGSTEPLATTTTHQLDQNIFFGGGLNAALEYFLSTNHDYMYFLNNDLVFHGPQFLTQSLREAKESNASIYSPSVINASKEQCHWKQMWNWGNSIREVRWIDFQAPLIRKDIAEKIQHFPDELIYGWGLDFYAGCIGETFGFKTVVSDNNTIAHMNSLTFKENKINIGVNEFCRNAEGNMNQYFASSPYKDKYIELRKYGEQYSDFNNNTITQ
jgi:hypothetical protein